MRWNPYSQCPLFNRSLASRCQFFLEGLMKNKSHRAVFLMLSVFLIAGEVSLRAQSGQTMRLPQPKKEGGMPLLQALNERHSAREFAPDKLSPQVLSNMLWAAWGINRNTGQRTAPSASNKQEIDIYVVMADGAWLYDAKANALQQVVSDDIRALTGTQPFVKDAPVNLVYVADLAKAGRTDPAATEFYTGADAGFIAENVYLFCASEGLATVVRASVDRAALAKALKLRSDQKIALAQSVGYTKK
jgi:nitroreductase